jgi:hypothetical protein
VKTFLDDVSPNESRNERQTKLKDFPTKFVPFATHFAEDLELCFSFFDALYKGVKILQSEISPVEIAIWDKAYAYMEARR